MTYESKNVENKKHSTCYILEEANYFHISRKSSIMEVGKELFIGKEKNCFNKFFDDNNMDYITRNGQFLSNSSAIDAMKAILRGNKNEVILKAVNPCPIAMISYLEDRLNHYLRFKREVVFEEVRKEFFPEKPSRQRCIWVIPPEEKALKYWWNCLGREGRLLKLSLSGVIHQTSQEYLNLSSRSIDHERGQAFKYWAGISGKRPEEDEILFEGFIKVLEEVVPSSYGL